MRGITLRSVVSTLRAGVAEHLVVAQREDQNAGGPSFGKVELRT